MVAANKFATKCFQITLANCLFSKLLNDAPKNLLIRSEVVIGSRNDSRCLVHWVFTQTFFSEGAEGWTSLVLHSEFFCNFIVLDKIVSRKLILQCSLWTNIHLNLINERKFKFSKLPWHDLWTFPKKEASSYYVTYEVKFRKPKNTQNFFVPSLK